MVQKTLTICSSITIVLAVVGITTIIITTIMATDGFYIHPVSGQTSSSSSNTVNMTGPMMESTRFHLRAADDLLMKGDTAAALDQINLAQLQLSLLNMNSQGGGVTTMNQTEAMEFIIGGSLSSMRIAANCIIDSEAKVRCMQ
jgi:hypothetical protein